VPFLVPTSKTCNSSQPFVTEINTFWPYKTLYFLHFQTTFN